MKFLRDIVVVRVQEQTMSDGGIHILEPVRAAHVQPAIVMDKGSKCKLPIEIGDIVYVSIYIGTPKTIHGLDVRVYDSSDVLAKQTK